MCQAWPVDSSRCLPQLIEAASAFLLFLLRWLILKRSFFKLLACAQMVYREVYTREWSTSKMPEGSREPAKSIH